MSDHVIKQLGFCGKIPARGDFVQSDFNGDFLKNWNEWLQAVVAVSREQVKDNWLEYYLTSPVWHFALSPGVCCESGVLGTVIPSVDQVSRHFPFTLAALHNVSPLQAWHKNNWSASFENVILEVLEDDFDLESWFKALKKQQQQVSGEQINVSHIESEDKIKKGWVIRGEMTPEPIELLHHQYLHHFGNYSLWWTMGSELVEPCFIVTDGLPQVSQFVAMMDGQWQQRNWNTSEIYRKEL